MKKILFSDAFFSKDRKHRYALWRVWNNKLPKVLFIGLNPSTADEVKDDPTIRRCINYAKDWGYGGYIMGNIFAYRSTDPKNLKITNNPIGIDNNSWLIKLHSEASLTIGAWGNHGKYLDRGREVINLIDDLYCLKVTKEGHPSHPLYLPGNLKPIIFKKK